MSSEQPEAVNVAAERRYIVLTCGRNEPLNGMHMDVKSAHGRLPMKLVSAQARAADIVRDERGVRAFVAFIMDEAVPTHPPVVLAPFRGLK